MQVQVNPGMRPSQVNILLSPEGEVNSGGYIQRRDPEGDSCFSICQIRWIKNASSISCSETFAKRRAIFLSVRKTVNIQGYSKYFQWLFENENNYSMTSCPSGKIAEIKGRIGSLTLLGHQKEIMYLFI